MVAPHVTAFTGLQFDPEFDDPANQALGRR